MIPSQNTGTAWPRRVSAIAPQSTAVPRRSAANVPSGKATTSAKTMAAIVNSIVAGRRSKTRLSAGSL